MWNLNYIGKEDKPETDQRGRGIGCRSQWNGRTNVVGMTGGQEAVVIGSLDLRWEGWAGKSKDLVSCIPSPKTKQKKSKNRLCHKLLVKILYRQYDPAGRIVPKFCWKSAVHLQSTRVHQW